MPRIESFVPYLLAVALLLFWIAIIHLLANAPPLP